MKQVQMYHFTCQYCYEVLGIKEYGLFPEDVPVPLRGLGIHGVWLTTDPSFEHQQWAKTMPVDKTELRISLRVDLDDKRLMRWIDYARKAGIPEAPDEDMSRECIAASYVYRDIIEPAQFERVEYRVVSNGKETIKEYNPPADLVAQLPPILGMKIGEYMALWVDTSEQALLKTRRIAEESLV